MQAVGYLLKTTIYFKDFYTYLTETYGLPNYVVMGIFVLITILLGLLLGIFFIVCIDFVCAPRKTKKEFKDTRDVSQNNSILKRNYYSYEREFYHFFLRTICQVLMIILKMN